MNHLAHLALAEANGPSMVGNMMADAIKGRQMQALPPAIQRGVRQHRAIDAFTDSHPAVRASIARLQPRWGRYAGIVTDVYYDHLLASGWAAHSAVPLREFLDAAHPLLLEQRPHLPPLARDTLERIVLGDRLIGYRNIDGVEAALRRLAGVLSRHPPLHQAVDDLSRHHAALAEDFAAFWPELTRFAAAQRGT